MPSIHRIWNFHETKTVQKILAQKQERDRELTKIFQEIRSELPKKAEDRMINSLIHRVKELEKEEIKSHTTIQRIIDKHEHTLCGTIAINTVKGFGFSIFVIGVGGAVVSAVELILEKLVEQRDGTQDIITSVFNVLVLFFTVIGTIGLCLQYLGQKAINKATKFRDLTWQERKEIKILLKYFQEMRSLQQIRESEDVEEDERWKLIEETFQKLLEQSHDIPIHFDNVTLFRNREELINYLLLSLPSDHPIREKIDILERYERDGILPDSSLPASNSSEKEYYSSLPILEASQGTGSETETLTEPEIEILPADSKEVEDTDFFLRHVEKKIKRGQTFEKGVFKGIRADQLESDEVKERIRRLQALCDTYLELESYCGLWQGFTKLRIGDLKVRRSKIFREMPHETYRRKSSTAPSAQEGPLLRYTPPEETTSSNSRWRFIPANWLKFPI